jgi:hypothetical protein
MYAEESPAAMRLSSSMERAKTEVWTMGVVRGDPET